MDDLRGVTAAAACRSGSVGVDEEAQMAGMGYSWSEVTPVRTGLRIRSQGQRPQSRMPKSADGGPCLNVGWPLLEQQLQLKNSLADGMAPCAGSLSSEGAPTQQPWLVWKDRLRRVASIGGSVLLVGLVALSAIIVKEYQHAPALARVQSLNAHAVETAELPQIEDPLNAPLALDTSEVDANVEIQATSLTTDDEPAWKSDPTIRYFNGRPVRPAKVIRMVVTAYSPDARSCDDSADGITATLHSVETNGFALVAADPRVLKYGSLLTVPGYDQDRIVPVLDCGGKIKGRRLDVLYPTHGQARKWGKKSLDVTVWEYADGLPAPNPRKLR